MRIALVSDEQHQSLVDLLCELYAYYNDTSAVTREDVRCHLQQNLLAADSPLRFVVAEDNDGGIVGFAAITLIYSLVDPTPQNRRQCHMKELYVRSSDRSRGIGQALMAWIARYANEHGCGRIDFSVKATNHAGIAFYTRLGAGIVAERLSYRLDRSAMARLVGTPGPQGIPGTPSERDTHN